MSASTGGRQQQENRGEVRGRQISNSKPGLLDFFFPHNVNNISCKRKARMSFHKSTGNKKITYYTGNLQWATLISGGLIWWRQNEQCKHVWAVQRLVEGLGHQSAGHTISLGPSQIPRIKIKSLHIPERQRWRKCFYHFALSENLCLDFAFGTGVLCIFWYIQTIMCVTAVSYSTCKWIHRLCFNEILPLYFYFFFILHDKFSVSVWLWFQRDALSDTLQWISVLL